MRLLFDQNISFRILNKIKVEFPEANQVRLLGLDNKSDIQIWKYAKDNQYAIVSFDADFYDLTVLKGHPPKIIWLRSGNTSTKFLADLLIKNKSIIYDFLNLKEWESIGCLELV
ncbi:DUF5615 family PIN-like protein [Cytophagaceae bacterium ABcell3]|nr:DUF5615 family PIN-like protein [Cytophagaceae bacterium ABcell3]